jgi:hypothetical protein
MPIAPNTGIRHAEALAADAAHFVGKVPQRITDLLAAHAALSGGPSGNPTDDLVREIATGGLAGDELTAAIAAAAAADAAVRFHADLRVRAEPSIMRAIVHELENGGADEIIDSLRPAFDEAVAVLKSARKHVEPSATAEGFLGTATAEGLAAWHSITPAVEVLNGIGYVVTQFGPLGQLEMVQAADPILGVQLAPEAVMFGGPNLDVVDATHAFRKPGMHRASPWFATSYALRLNTIAEARERVRAIGEVAFDAMEHRRVAGRTEYDAGGKKAVAAQPRRNPYALASSGGA